MILKAVTGMVASLVVVMALGTSASAGQIASPLTGNVTYTGALPTATFKTSPNVYIQYVATTAGAGSLNTSYVAASRHNQGDKAYGVDPDYTGMYIESVTVGVSTITNFPSAATAGSTGDFNTSNWTAK